MKRLAAGVLVAAGLLAWRQLGLRVADPAPPRPRLVLAAEDASAGFARAETPRELVLPRDHGPHFEYQTEWWYYTGQLEADGERFGYQLTIFRRGLSPGPPPDGPGLATNQVYFAHLALTDVARRRHVFFERWSRGGAGLAEAGGEPYRVALLDWTVEGLDREGSQVRLRARSPAIGLDLVLRAEKPLVRHGDRGLSSKSEAPGNASYYIGYTRMASAGTLRLDGRELSVRGSSWFDHEWSTSALSPEAVGWDWFSLQLDDGREVMFFRIRRRDGSDEPVSGGTLVAPDGATRRIRAGDLTLETTARWQSPLGGVSYPSRWSLAIASERLELQVEPLVADQELRASVRYWEGAVDVSGTSHGQPLRGRGYVELTGYAAPMQGLF